MTSPNNTYRTAFTRGFKLHLPGGQVLDGAAFPSSRALVIDDPEHGLATIASSVDELLKGYHRARIAWADDALEGERPTVDTITSDQLDALILQAARMRHAVQQYAELRAQLEDTEERARRAELEVQQGESTYGEHALRDTLARLNGAEAAIARVRALAEQWQAAMRPGEQHPAARAVLTALDEPSAT